MRLLIATMVCLLPLMAQDGAPKGGQKKGGGQPPKNLKILPPDNLMGVMRSYTVALGVRCDACHIQGDFASDENPKKNTARMMIAMVNDINAKFPADAKLKVTCYTCHRGAATPLSAPPPAAPAPGL